MGEFELIRRYFARPSAGRRLLLAGGDDCALWSGRAGYDLALSTDMLVAGRHFLADGEPTLVGFKSLAVNLSDLAAMGATPLGFTLALALPRVEPDWLERFAAGLYSCADAFACPLAGGDTTRGPLTISITVLGELEAGTALRRDGARVGDEVWVSGSLGGAALALRLRNGAARAGVAPPDALFTALDRPVPRVALGDALRGVAHAAIDVSDGLVGDLGHVLRASAVGASICAAHVPVPAALADEPDALRLACALAGGDDYELCFTAAPERHAAIEALGSRLGLALTPIGSIEPTPGLRWVAPDGTADALPASLRLAAFDHFG